MLVDAHQHFWQLGRFDYPWMSSDLGVLYRDYLPPALEPILKANEVGKTVLVQASNSVEESRWLIDLADQYPRSSRLGRSNERQRCGPTGSSCTSEIQRCAASS